MAFAFGCASTGKPGGPKKVWYPDWYGLQSEAGDYVYAYGEAKKMNNVTAFESAKAMAFNEAAQYVENYVKAMTKDFLKEAGTENTQVLQLTERTVKLVSKTKFSGVTVSKRETVQEEGRFRSFVRLSIPGKEVKNTLLNTIKNEEALYNEFKASQSFKELEKETEKYNE
ncbi:MAG: hypothetical protein H8D22_00885 [Candidatus Cloacimonetes bacterium]|nr:hypothetical protein [Candidatus Cloacimonadota bacterium]